MATPQQVLNMLTGFIPDPVAQAEQGAAQLRQVMAPGRTPQQRLMDILGGLGAGDLTGMTVYHGTPHRFAPTPRNPLGEFDLSKIGTGEGAQAYGHGAYLAENPEVARSYKPRQFKSAEYAGTDFPSGTTRANTLYGVATRGKAETEKRLEESIRFNDQYAPTLADVYRGELEFVRRLDPGKVQVHGVGTTYKVDLPDEQVGRMLHWDLPLVEQPDAVRTAIARLMSSPEGATAMGRQPVQVLQQYIRDVGGQLRGSDLWHILEKEYGPAQAAQVMSAHGVPGIRYLDQGSRAAGGGSHNYAVWNPEILKILGME